MPIKFEIEEGQGQLVVFDKPDSLSITTKRNPTALNLVNIPVKTGLSNTTN